MDIKSVLSLKNHPNMREFLAEMLGTFILMVFGIGSVAQAVLSENTHGNHLSIHWSWGFGVALGVSVAVGVTDFTVCSGGHINPAVTLTNAIFNNLAWYKVPLYTVAQFTGSFLASAIVYFVYQDAMNNYDGGNRQVTGQYATAGIWSTYPQPFLSIWNGLADQVFGTAILLIGVMALTDQRHHGANSAGTPFFIGGLVVAIGMTFGFNCGYAINPARDFAPRVFTFIAGWGLEVFSFRNYHWFIVPILGPYIGAFIGASIYKLSIEIHWPKEYEFQGNPVEINNRGEGKPLILRTTT